MNIYFVVAAAFVVVGFLALALLALSQAESASRKWLLFQPLFDRVASAASEVETLEWRLDELMRMLERDIDNFVIPSDIGPPTLTARGVVGKAGYDGQVVPKVPPPPPEDQRLSVEAMDSIIPPTHNRARTQRDIDTGRDLPPYAPSLP